METSYVKLEFNVILDMLAGYALSDGAKEKLKKVAPYMSEDQCRRKMNETTGARQILDACGTPPITAMQDIAEALTLCKAGAMLAPEQLNRIAQFLTACARLQGYLQKAQQTCEEVAAYGQSFALLPQLKEEITRCIRADMVDSEASPGLRSVRRKAENAAAQIQSEMANLLQSKKQWLSNGAVVQRNGRFVLPVRKEHKNKINGTVVEMSGTGGTVFIEPASVAKLQQQLMLLRLEEENEVRAVLYTLSALVDENAGQLHMDMEAMETLDVLFAKAKLSAAMKAGPVEINAGRQLVLREARHPLLAPETCVPLNIAMGQNVRGVVITGPNTGGKTVALKTIGLLCLMAQSGLHITAQPTSTICMHNAYLCDVGDGQSIHENLSTFSAHMACIIEILERADEESLVLLDELGSGTDPAEGMGIAVAVLEALRQKGCMLVATTHYPEVKGYAEQAEGFTNARMEFDRETLNPTYRLEVGKAGESCALYIARRLGLPKSVLDYAQQAAYAGQARPQEGAGQTTIPAANLLEEIPAPVKNKIKPSAPLKPESAHAAAIGFGDSVMVHPKQEIGIVFATANPKGEIGVQVKGEKLWVPHKRLKLITPAAELYPEDYDFSVIFDTVANRKARKKMDKRHIAGNVVTCDANEWKQ